MSSDSMIPPAGDGEEKKMRGEKMPVKRGAVGPPRPMMDGEERSQATKAPMMDGGRRR